MGRAVSVPQRRAIFERSQRGRRTEQIAADRGLPSQAVRTLIRRFRCRGAAGIPPGSDHCGSHQTHRADPERIAVAPGLRRAHPTWGAGLIRVLLAEHHPGRSIPSERALQGAFVGAESNSAPAGRRRRPGETPRRATQPQETRQGRSTPPSP